MKVAKVWEYENCSTCKKALKFLANHNIAIEKIDITKNPPSKAELKQMLPHVGGNFKKLFNTSGRVYQSQNMKEKVATMTEDQALTVLAGNGMLVKRPFVLWNDKGLVGFDPKKWGKVFER